MKAICTGSAPNFYIHSCAFTQKADGEWSFLGSPTLGKAAAVHLMPPPPLATPFPSLRWLRLKRNQLHYPLPTAAGLSVILPRFCLLQWPLCLISPNTFTNMLNHCFTQLSKSSIHQQTSKTALPWETGIRALKKGCTQLCFCHSGS